MTEKTTPKTNPPTMVSLVSRLNHQVEIRVSDPSFEKGFSTVFLPPRGKIKQIDRTRIIGDLPKGVRVVEKFLTKG